MELQVPILALSQLNRQLESQNRKPILSDLRESGSIEQDCDAAFLVSKEEELDATRDKIRFHVAKNRGGETDQTIFLTFEKSLGSFQQFSAPSLNNEKPAF